MSDGRLTSVKRRRRVARLLERDGNRCHICDQEFDPEAVQNSPGEMTIDHLVPWNEGGGHHLDNLKLAHRRCNEGRNEVRSPTARHAPRDPRPLEVIPASEATLTRLAQGNVTIKLGPEQLARLSEIEGDAA